MRGPSRRRTSRQADPKGPSDPHDLVQLTSPWNMISYQTAKLEGVRAGHRSNRASTRSTVQDDFVTTALTSDWHHSLRTTHVHCSRQKGAASPTTYCTLGVPTEAPSRY